MRGRPGPNASACARSGSARLARDLCGAPGLHPTRRRAPKESGPAMRVRGAASHSAGRPPGAVDKPCNPRAHQRNLSGFRFRLIGNRAWIFGLPRFRSGEQGLGPIGTESLFAAKRSTAADARPRQKLFADASGLGSGLPAGPACGQPCVRVAPLPPSRASSSRTASHRPCAASSPGRCLRAASSS